jgi:flagellar protein FliO/FliZ
MLHQRADSGALSGDAADDRADTMLGNGGGAGGTGAGWILQTITALGVVIGLILLLRWAYAKLTGQVAATSSSPVMEVLSRTTLAPRNQVLLVRLGQRILVVGDSPAGLRTLANVDDAEEVASLLAAVSAAKPNSITGGFSQLLSRFNGDYESQVVDTEGGDDGEHHVDRARSSIGGLLSRIRTVGGAR